MKILFGLTLALLISCNIKQEPHEVVESIPDEFLMEYFVDSLTIGNKTKNKIELSLYKTIADSSYVIINFYTKQKNSWVLRNQYTFEKDGLTGLDTKLSDYNNDGLLDLTYVSAVAARGANEVRRLFIYDKANDELILMKNSEHYPNMLYNKELDCIDSWMVYGGCSTVFLEISGDSLRELASVNIFQGLSVVTFDEWGEEKRRFEDSTYNGVNERFKSYQPLKVYEKSELK